MSHILGIVQFVFSLGVLLVPLLMGNGCTTTTNKPNAPFTLDNPVQVRSQTASLIVGKNRWIGQRVQVTELFWPIAVTMRNTGTQTLCGGVATATLSDASGASTSAIFPEGVVARLIGPLALLHSRELFLRPSHATFTSSTTPKMGFIHASLRTNESQFQLMPVWGPGGFGGGFGGGVSGGFGLDPFWGSGFPSPFYDPWSPFGRFPHGRRFHPLEEPPVQQPEEKKTPMLQEIFSVAFTSHPLAPQEERSGFLFFPSPPQITGTQTLTWDWYDCTTQVLLAHFTLPISPAFHSPSADRQQES